MNKLFTKIATLALGATMAVGVGVALGASKASVAHAEACAVALTDKATSEKINGVDGYKIGTSSASGTITVTIPANTNKLEFYAAAWKGQNNVSLSLTPTGVTPASTSIAINSSDGATNNGPFTVENESNYKVSLDITDSASGGTIAFTASKRVLFWSFESYTPGTVVTYSVTYIDNGATSGSVPTDSNAYNKGATATVLGNTGSLVKEGFTFAGWNTEPNGSGTTYQAGATISVNDNVKLYAKWDLNYQFEHAGTMDDPFGAKDAYFKAQQTGTTATSDLFYISGTVDKFTESFNKDYGNFSFNVVEGDYTFLIFRVYDGRENETANNKFTEESDLKVGDTVLVHAKIVNYNNKTAETSNGFVVKINDITPSEKTLVSIALSGSLTKTAYYVGNSWDHSGLTVTATFDDQSTQDVTSSASWTYTPAIAESTTVNSVSIQASYTYKQVTKTATNAYTVSVSEKTGMVDTFHLDGTQKIIAATRDSVTYYLQQNGAKSPLGVTDKSLATVFTLKLVDDDTFEFYVTEDNKTSYLYALKSDNSGLRYGTGDYIQWKIAAGYQPTSGDPRGGQYDIWNVQTPDTRYISLYQGTNSQTSETYYDWRIYTSASATNRKENIDLVDAGSTPIETFSVTYLEGNVADTFDVDAGTSIVLREANPELVPEGQEFKGWQNGNAIYQPGAPFVVNADALFTALYEDSVPLGELQYIEITSYPTKQLIKLVNNLITLA